MRYQLAMLWVYLCQDLLFWLALLWCIATLLLLPVSTHGWNERRAYLLVVVFPGLVALAGSVWWERRRLALLRNGQVVIGRVEGFVHRGGRRRASPVRLSYAFSDDQGVRRQGLSGWLLPEDRRQFAIWGPVRVVYDPAHPQRHEPDVFGFRQEVENDIARLRLADDDLSGL